MGTFLLWTGYFALHSLLAADWLKKRVASTSLHRYYRLCYNLIALSGLVLLAVCFFREPVNYLLAPSAFSRSGGLLLLLAGAAIILPAFRNYSLLEFSGLEHLTGAAPPPVLRTDGLNSWVRHPLYLGTLVAVVGGWLLFPTHAATAVAAAVLVYLPFGIYFEEKKLLRQFGEAYAEYRKRVKGLIPFVW